MNGDSEVCPLCQDSPDDPRCLPCLHLLCNSCLGKLAEHGIPGTASGSRHGISSITCPICSTKFQAEYQNISRFPRAIRCRSCTKFVKAVREFRCSHVNKDICLDCVVEESGEGMSLSCPSSPKCGTSTSGPVAELPPMYLCNVCRQFKREKSCKVCYWKLVFGSSEQTEMDQAQRNAEQRENQNRGREFWMNERNGSKNIFFLIFFVVLVAIFYRESVKDMWSKEPASRRYKGRDTRNEEHAYQWRKESKTSKKPQYVEKREPTYIKDCYDLVTPDGKKYDRKCEKLFSGYRTVKVRIPPGG